MNRKRIPITILVFIGIILLILAIYFAPRPNIIFGDDLRGELVFGDHADYFRPGIVMFELHLNNPENPRLNDITIIVLDNHGQYVENYSANWTHLVSDSQHVKTGDRLIIEIPNTDMGGYDVVISIKGYSGTISEKVPTH
jgi:hypothetical protein